MMKMNDGLSRSLCELNDGMMKMNDGLRRLSAGTKTKRRCHRPIRHAWRIQKTGGGMRRKKKRKGAGNIIALLINEGRKAAKKIKKRDKIYFFSRKIRARLHMSKKSSNFAGYLSRCAFPHTRKEKR